jgi:hypothetical protein
MTSPGVPISLGPGGRWTSPNPAWAHLMQRESNGDPQVIQSGYTDVNTGGNEAEGLFQITPETWRKFGGAKYAASPRLATPHQQAEVAADIFRASPDGSDWGAGLPGREDPNELAAGLGMAGRLKQQPGQPAPMTSDPGLAMQRRQGGGGIDDQIVGGPDQRVKNDPQYSPWRGENRDPRAGIGDPSDIDTDSYYSNRVGMQGGGPVGMQGGGPLFTDEGPQYYDRAYQHNKPFATAGPYQTPLPAPQEQQFRQWVQQKRVPFDPNAAVVDYDMRGYWKDTGGAWEGGKTHFPDTYKTPYDTTFSKESKYATPNCPFTWQGDNLIDTRDGSLVFGAPAASPKPTPAPARPPAQYFVKRANGGMIPLPVRQVGPHDWDTVHEVPMGPGDEIVAKPWPQQPPRISTRLRRR